MNVDKLKTYPLSYTHKNFLGIKDFHIVFHIIHRVVQREAVETFFQNFGCGK